MRLTRKHIRHLILEEIEDFEGSGEISVDRKTRLSESSVDDQIDSLFIKFESESIKEGKSAKSIYRFMFEAPEDEEEASGEEDEEVESAGPSDEEDEDDDVLGSEDREVELSAEPETPPLDVDSFVKDVARLIENYDSLLDIKTVILHRAKNYLDENYDEATSSAFEDALEVNYGIAIDAPDNDPVAPNADGAGPIA